MKLPRAIADLIRPEPPRCGPFVSTANGKRVNAYRPAPWQNLWRIIRDHPLKVFRSRARWLFPHVNHERWPAPPPSSNIPQDNIDSRHDKATVAGIDEFYDKAEAEIAESGKDKTA